MIFDEENAKVVKRRVKNEKKRWFYLKIVPQNDKALIFPHNLSFVVCTVITAIEN